MSGSIPSWARVGVKVTCIKQGAWRSMNGGQLIDYGETRPVYGVVYTIREVVLRPGLRPSIMLAEIVNTPRTYAEGFLEKSFGLHCFRPLITKDHEAEDIATFRKLLHVDQHDEALV